MTYTPEQQAFREEVRAWLAANVPSEIFDWARTSEETRETYRLRRELGRKLGEKGWLYPAAPQRYGGGGLGVDEVIILEEEANRLGLMLPPYYDSGGMIGSATILVWGTEEQKSQFLPPIYTGQVRTWQLLSEPSAGSDLAGVRMTALKDGSEYVLNGQKSFVGSDHGADRMWILAVTDPSAKRHENLGWFMIDANLPGITVQPMDLLSTVGEGEGDIGHKNTVFFDNVRVPEDCLIGGENNGWEVATTHLEIEHGLMALIGRDRLWGRLLSYCQNEMLDGKRLVDDPDVRDALSDIYIADEVNRLLRLRNFWLIYTDRPRSYEGAQTAYLRKTTGLWKSGVILRAIGARALTSDPVWGAGDGFLEEQQREAIVEMHPGGTADIQRVIMARRIGTGRSEKEQPGRLS